MEARSLGDVGGTPGGLGHFVIGFVMACMGGYFLANQVSVVGSYWSFYGANTFGITLAPMLLGVGILFWNGRSLAGWIVTAAGALFILAGVIANMSIYFRPTSPFNTLVMLILLVGGLGLIARALRPHPAAKSELLPFAVSCSNFCHRGRTGVRIPFKGTLVIASGISLSLPAQIRGT